jgi:glycosyltransferase involved in cell wall biosynthesis
VSARLAFAMSGDPRDRAVYSGLPASLYAALEALGIELTPIDVELPGRWQRLLVNAMTVGFLDPPQLARSVRSGRSIRLAFRDNKPKLHPSREMTAIRSAVAAARLRRQPIDAAVSFGCEFSLPAGTDYVTLDDATIAQLRRSYDYHWMEAVPDQALRRMMARQRQIYDRARGCCFVSHWAARSAVEDYGIPAARVHVVGCGPNRVLRPAERDWTAPCFLFVGKDFERKNGPLLLRAFDRVRSQNPTATLDLVGGHPRVDREGVTGHGLLSLDRPDEVARVNALFERATCFVMPSRLEPAGYVFAEALAAGIGSIGPGNGGSQTIIGEAGATVEPDDPDELTTQMLRFCDPLQSQAFAAKARRRAPLFTWRATAERVVRALELPGFEHASLAKPL